MESFELSLAWCVVRNCNAAIIGSHEFPQFLEEAVAAVDTVGVPWLALLHRSEEHLVEAESVSSEFLYYHVGVDHIKHTLRHLLHSPSADIFAFIIKDELSVCIVRTPCLEGFDVEDVGADDVDIDVDRCDVVAIFLVEGDEGVGVLDAVDKVAASLYHALIYKFLEGLFFA